MRNICFADASHLVLLYILFVLKVKLRLFLPIQRCAFWFNLNIFLCRYASRTLRIKLLTWCRVISLAGHFGSGRSRDLILSKYFGLISSLHTKLFITLRVTTFFFGDVDLLCAVTSVSEVIAIFLQLIMLANTAVFFHSLLGFVSHCFWEGDSCVEISMRWGCVEKINHSRDSWLVSRSLQAFFSYL